MEKHITYWIESANHDFDVAESLFDNGKYDWCLFIAHLVLEKILKACYVQCRDEFPPRTHDLVKLAHMAGVELKEETLEFLDLANTFNISTRYPDEKFKFYSLCTKDFAAKNFNKIKEIMKCLLKKIIY